VTEVTDVTAHISLKEAEKMNRNELRLGTILYRRKVILPSYAGNSHPQMKIVGDDTDHFHPVCSSCNTLCKVSMVDIVSGPALRITAKCERCGLEASRKMYLDHKAAKLFADSYDLR